MIAGTVKELFPGERRVAIVPRAIPPFVKAGWQLLVEAGAGALAGYPDTQYVEHGARIVPSRSEVFAASDAVLQVVCYSGGNTAGKTDLALLRRDQVLVGFLDPLGSPGTVREIAATGAVAFAVELMPRLSRAQSMDALSALATVIGYKAVLLAAVASPRMFPMLMTAAGSVTPARVLVVGAGVMGLQAIATARRLGAVVSAYDVRPTVQEEVQSLGARFVELPLETADAQDARGYARQQDEAFYQRQRALMARVVSESDVVITTAVVPGARAPVLITTEMVAGMTPGSVIVDLAAERGGNCELTRPGETVVAHDVAVIGPVNLASTVPHHASQLYARAVGAFLLHLAVEGKFGLNAEDEITRETLVTRGGEVVQPRVRAALGLAPLATGLTGSAREGGTR